MEVAIVKSHCHEDPHRTGDLYPDLIASAVEKIRKIIYQSQHLNQVKVALSVPSCAPTVPAK